MHALIRGGQQEAATKGDGLLMMKELLLSYRQTRDWIHQTQGHHLPNLGSVGTAPSAAWAAKLYLWRECDWSGGSE